MNANINSFKQLKNKNTITPHRMTQTDTEVHNPMQMLSNLVEWGASPLTVTILMLQ